MARISHRNDVLEAAWDLFWERGFNATSIADIAKRAGLPKGSIYNYFESKDALLLAAIGRLKLQAESELRSKVLEGTPSPGEIVDRVIGHYLEEFAKHDYGRGDITSNLLSELSETRPDLTNEINKIAAARRTIMAQKIWAYGTTTRTPQLMEHAEALASVIWSALQGALLQMKATHSSQPLVEAKRTLRDMVDTYVTALAAGELNEDR